MQGYKNEIQIHAHTNANPKKYLYNAMQIPIQIHANACTKSIHKKQQTEIAIWAGRPGRLLNTLTPPDA
jgi:hypothetical protein